MSYHVKMINLKKGEWEDTFTPWCFLEKDEAYDKAIEYVDWIEINKYDRSEFKTIVWEDTKDGKCSILFDSEIFDLKKKGHNYKLVKRI